MLNNDALKSATTLDQQIEILKSRGLIIADDITAKTILSFVGYYRLSAYSLGLRDNDKFHDGVAFDRDIRDISV